MKMVNNQLVPVYETDKGNKVVDARELHEFLGSRQEFANWIKNRIEKYGFIMDEDYLIILSKTPSGGRPTTDYTLSLDMAKELAMVENNKKGREVRKYFINIEKSAKQQQIPQPKSQAELTLMLAQQSVELEKKIEILDQRINNLDKVDTDGSERDQFNKMIRMYANRNGIQFDQAYRDFVQAFNTAYKTNVKLLITNYCMNNNLNKLTTPDYLERTGKLIDAIRVADKMLNKEAV